MLLFIANSARLMLPRRQFQYISCYSLSLQNLKKLHTDSCFNTSHVTLYRNFHGEMYFQEICFNTSHVTLYQLVAARMEVLAVSFNTSHVTLYRSFIFHILSPKTRFNTSHVTLYLLDPPFL